MVMYVALGSVVVRRDFHEISAHLVRVVLVHEQKEEEVVAFQMSHNPTLLYPGNVVMGSLLCLPIQHSPL
jgi:hypothetical protein